MKTRRLTNFSEGKALGILERTFRGTSYVAHPKVRLADVVVPDEEDQLVHGDKDFLLRAHLDFVVCDRSQAMTPVFAVEFDGPGHASEKQRVRDIRKNRLCVNAELPLLRIGHAEIEEHDRMTLLGHMMGRAVAWKSEGPSIQAEIEAAVEELEDPEHELTLGGGILKPDYDVTFQFHLRHLFPGIAAVCKRLWLNYRMGSLFDVNTFYTCDYALMHRWKMEWVHGHDLFTIDYFIGRTDGRPPDFRDGEFRSGELLHTGTVQFSIQSVLQTREDYDWLESPSEYQERTGEEPYASMRFPGGHMMDIGESFTDYLCLRDAEEWAKANLRRAQRNR